jgi:hypothetical protein
MGKLTRVGYAILDSILEERGEEWFHKEILNKLVDGMRMKDIALSLGLPSVVMLRAWIEQNCADDVALAYRARADDLEWQATQEVTEASMTTVPLAKLRADHYMKIAGKLDRSKWGDKENTGNGGITVVVDRAGVVSINETPGIGDRSHEIAPIVIEHNSAEI